MLFDARCLTLFFLLLMGSPASITKQLLLTYLSPCRAIIVSSRTAGLSTSACAVASFGCFTTAVWGPLHPASPCTESHLPALWCSPQPGTLSLVSVHPVAFICGNDIPNNILYLCGILQSADKKKIIKKNKMIRKIQIHLTIIQKKCLMCVWHGLDEEKSDTLKLFKWHLLLLPH